MVAMSGSRDGGCQESLDGLWSQAVVSFGKVARDEHGGVWMVCDLQVAAGDHLFGFVG
jgi:hypothetical protein